jgi:hypothetical protein
MCGELRDARGVFLNNENKQDGDEVNLKYQCIDEAFRSAPFITSMKALN